MQLSRLCSILLLCTAAACGSERATLTTDPGPKALEGRPGGPTEAGARPEEDDGPLLREWPWTDAFMKKAALLADRVHVSGPKGLLDHTVVTQDPDISVYETLTTPEGLRLRTTLRPDVTTEDPIRAQLDALQIFALREVVVLERPGAVDVQVIATGDAYWHEVATGKELRGERLVLDGVIVRGEGAPR